jgi:hypothetical protein
MSHMRRNHVLLASTERVYQQLHYSLSSGFFLGQGSLKKVEQSL